MPIYHGYRGDVSVENMKHVHSAFTKLLNNSLSIVSEVLKDHYDMLSHLQRSIE